MRIWIDILSYLPFAIVLLYVLKDIFTKHPAVEHTIAYKARRALNWVPLGLTYAFLYMARYNLTVSKNAFGDLMTKEDFGIIFAIGTFTYAFSFLINGPLTDKFGGKKAIVASGVGAAVANILMGFITYGIVMKNLRIPLTVIFSILYAINMYFQSFGAVAIVKVNAAWFHVRERGTFGGIFGILISLGIFFAFDWGKAIVDATLATVEPVKLSWFQLFLRNFLGIAGSPVDQTWWVFFVPSMILLIFVILDILIIRDQPAGAGFWIFLPTHRIKENIYTADASAGEDDKPFKLSEILTRILTNKIILTIAFIEFCTGVLRNGVMHWYSIFTNEYQKAAGVAEPLPVHAFMKEHWGLMLMLAGVLGGMFAGTISDRVFQSRRGPVAALLYAMLFVGAVLMGFTVGGDQMLMAIAVVGMSFAVIGTHGVLSGTSTMDFGGRRAAGTAVGLIDGFVYLGTGFQSLSLGFITTRSWGWWPIFLIPFTLLGFFLALRIWKALPTPKARPAH
jgi:OPA family glycerol-3-phosphate transporter-like MFS transporter